MYSILQKYSTPFIFFIVCLFTLSCTESTSKEEDETIAPIAEPVTLKVMPLGNSITQGGEVQPSYRYELWKMLLDSDMDVEFVGSMDTNWFRDAPNTEQGADVASPKLGATYKGQTFTNKHEGHWGWTTAELLNGKENPTAYKRDKGKLNDWLKGYTPDVVLMHLGTNDIIYSKGINNTIDRIEQIVTQLRADNKDVAILLAKITPIPTTFAPTDSTNKFNSLIPGLASKLSTPTSPVIVVDANAGFNPSVHTYDGLHPNEEGEKLIAKRWHDALVANRQTLYKLAK